VTTLREAAKQALEALEHENTMVDRGDGHWEFKHDLAITALRAALAEQVKAPHMYPLQSDRMRIDPVTGNVGIGTPNAEPEQEPVWVQGELPPRYVARSPIQAPQRKPLTNEEIEAIRIKEEFDLWGIREGAFKYCARSIEHAHGIKENP